MSGVWARTMAPTEPEYTIGPHVYEGSDAVRVIIKLPEVIVWRER